MTSHSTSPARTSSVSRPDTMRSPTRAPSSPSGKTCGASEERPDNQPTPPLTQQPEDRRECRAAHPIIRRRRRAHPPMAGDAAAKVGADRSDRQGGGPWIRRCPQGAAPMVPRGQRRQWSKRAAAEQPARRSPNEGVTVTLIVAVAVKVCSRAAAGAIREPLPECRLSPAWTARDIRVVRGRKASFDTILLHRVWFDPGDSRHLQETQ